MKCIYTTESSACRMPRVADMAVPLLREIADGRIRSVDELEEILAKFTGLVQGDSATRTKSGPASDARHKIGRVKSSLKKAGLVSYPSRGSVRITRKGLAEIGGDPGRLDLQTDMPSGARSGKDLPSAPRDAKETSSVYSPPLSPAELADIEAIASGAEKLRPVSMSEFLRIVDGDAGQEDVDHRAS